MSARIETIEYAGIRARLEVMPPTERQEVLGIARVPDARRGAWPNWKYETRIDGRGLGYVEIDYDRGRRIARWHHLILLSGSLMARPGSSLGLGTLFETLVLEDLVHAYGPLISIGHAARIMPRRVAQLACLGESPRGITPILDAIAHRRDYLAGKGFDPDARPFRSSIGRYLETRELMPL